MSILPQPRTQEQKRDLAIDGMNDLQVAIYDLENEKYELFQQLKAVSRAESAKLRKQIIFIQKTIMQLRKSLEGHMFAVNNGLKIFQCKGKALKFDL